jgi:hypothetical protein
MSSGHIVCGWYDGLCWIANNGSMICRTPSWPQRDWYIAVPLDVQFTSLSCGDQDGICGNLLTLPSWLSKS